MITFAPCLFLITLLSCIIGSLQATCDENEFKCADESCIDSFLVCDGEKNCPDGSDETKAVCTKAITRCPPFSFRCAYGACIDAAKKCNGKQDCADNSDEIHPDCASSVRVNNSLTNDDCHMNQFRCESGQCINQWSTCDGEENCRDGSDETEALCVNFNCPIVGFQCNYGGCIDKDKKCNGIRDCKDNSDEDPLICFETSVNPVNTGSGSTPVSSQGGCALPDYPEGGSFAVGNCEDKRSPKCRGEPGTLVDPNTIIIFNCWKNFGLSTEYNSSTCFMSNWTPRLPTCLKLCQPLKDDSLIITCTYKDSPVSCNFQVKPDTKAKVSCKPYHTTKGYASEENPICDFNGVWSKRITSCTPECGIRSSNNVIKLVSFGKPVKAIEYPWYSGIYSIRTQEHFCGGTIISPYVILTAAHCFYDNNNNLIEASTIRITVGKTFRNWTTEEPNEQRFQIANMYIHPAYYGKGYSYGFDLALLEVKGYIKISSLSMPICVEKVQPWTVIPLGSNGTVVGFGRDEHNKPTDQLQAVNLTYSDFKICKQKAPTMFKNFVTADKFCGIFKDGAGVQQGDSGGGYVFFKPENSLYYIRGIVSTKPFDKNDFATFTNISEKTHMDFIKQTLLDIDRNHING